ncbi:MAG: DNA polymerase III subunit delta, partial [Bacteroidales bacterium]
MTTFDEVMQQLVGKKYAPVYLLMGEEPFFIDQITDYIENHILETQDRDFNQVILYGKDTDTAEILANAKEFPFASPCRVVMVKEAKDLKDIDSLKSYIENPSPTTILVICYKYGKLKAAQYKSYEKKGILFVSEPIKDNKLPAWVQAQALKHHFKLNAQAANILSEHIGNDLTRINNEFLKLKIILPENSEITPEVIEKNIGISKEYNV